MTTETTTGAATGTEGFARVLEALRKRLTKQQFVTWFQRATLVSWASGELVIGLPNRFYQEWFHKNFRTLIASAAEEVAHAPSQVSFVVASSDAAPPDEGGAAPAERALAEPVPSVPMSPFSGTGPDDAPLRLNAHYTFENFIVGPSNRIAYASAKAVAHDPGRAYNPLFLHGSVGLGKTHLLHAVCSEFHDRNAGDRICFLSCEEFTNEFVLALQRHDLERFRARFRNVQLLVIDDIHFLAGKERTQEEFFHTFNQLFQQHRQIVVSSDAPPSEIPTLEERLVSRFKWGLVVQLEQPEMETRMAIIRRKAELMGVQVPNDVVEFVAHNFRNNIRELEGALLSLTARARVAEVPIDMALARQALEPSLHDGRPATTIEDVAEAVAAHFQVKVQDLRSKKRSRSVSLPRQVVMFIARRVTNRSLDEIGEAFGGRDHSTVLYAIRRVGEQVDTDPRFAAEVHHIQDRLGGR
jgi:chromosomal replication initiator protein